MERIQNQTMMKRPVKEFLLKITYFYNVSGIASPSREEIRVRFVKIEGILADRHGYCKIRAFFRLRQWCDVEEYERQENGFHDAQNHYRCAEDSDHTDLPFLIE
jgi:hypothetical protein